jgi:hypothetical protein
VQPVTFDVPASSAEPINVRVGHSGLRMVLVNRESVGLLDSETWGVLGLYFLIGPSADGKPDRYLTYVGEVGRRTLLMRLKEHVLRKAWWSRALVIASSADVGFNSAEIGWLEGRLYDVLKNAAACDVDNKGRPGDNSLVPQDRALLERYVEPVMAALRACGVSPDTTDQKPPPPPSARRRVYRESVKDLIDAGILTAGTVLTPLRASLVQTAIVLPDGTLKVADQVFASVSAAAQAVSGNTAEAGWNFWGAPSGSGGHASLATLREHLRDDGATTSPAPPDSSHEGAVADSPSRGHSPQPAGGRRTPRHYAETVGDLIEGQLLQIGQELQSVRKSLASARATVRPDGSLEVEGQVHKSPSAAACAASGRKAEPGWDFWAIERDGTLVSLSTLRTDLRSGRDPY